MSKPLYILDANTLIEAANRYYAFDVAPGFWRGLLPHIQSKALLTVDRVCGEIEKGKDDLCVWTTVNLKPTQGRTDQADVIAEFGKMMKWVNDQPQFFQAAKSEFASVADGWLMAYAKAKNGIVVTHEVFSKDVKKKVPIPNVCQTFGINYIDTFELLRQLKITLN